MFSYITLYCFGENVLKLEYNAEVEWVEIGMVLQELYMKMTLTQLSLNSDGQQSSNISNM
jgi:hypothetical protein